MKKFTVVLLSIAFVLSLGTVAMAAVANTAHDMDAYDGPGGSAGSPNPARGGTCSYCHIPHGAAGARLWPSAPVTAAELWKQTTIGNLCWSCHNGLNFGAANQPEPFFDSAHGRILAVLNEGDSVPGTVPLEDDGQLKCTSCHDVHYDATAAGPAGRPFQLLGSGELVTSCVVCHAGHSNDAPARRDANFVGTTTTDNKAMHPSRSTITDVAGGAGYLGRNLLAAPDIRFLEAYAGTVLSGGWNMGGHLAGGTATFATDPMVCTTCHMVHGEDAAPAPVPNALLVIDQVFSNNSPLCQGCHEANPGAAGTVTHPINTSDANWTAAITQPAGWTFANDGANDYIICNSCHTGAHYGWALTTGQALWRDATAADDEPTYGPFCGACHASGNETTWGHHPSGTVYNARPTPSISLADADVDWATRAWNPSGPAYSFGTGNIMNCGTCHGGGNARAHNNTGAAFPGIVGTVAESEMCVDCHDFNPSNYTVNEGTGAYGANARSATHYVGPINTPAYAVAGAFGVSGITPIYAADGSANGELICYSCHYILRDGGGLVKQTSDNTGVIGGATRDVDDVTCLSAPAGDDNLAAVAADYMCTHCHMAGLNNLGTTHPSLPFYDVAPTMGAPGGRATFNSNNRVNCESCHRPHDAQQYSGALIMENVTAGSDKAEWSVAADSGVGNFTDQEGLCGLCHTAN